MKGYDTFDGLASQSPDSQVIVPRNPRLTKWEGWVYVHSDILIMSEKEEDKLIGSLYGISNIDQWQIPTKINVTLRCAMHYFKESLLTWEFITQGKERWMPSKELAIRSILHKHEFAAYAKDTLESNIRYKTQEGKLYEGNLDVPDIDAAWGHDFFFPPAMLPNFRIPEKKADIDRLLVEPPPIEAGYKELFRSYISQYLTNTHFKVELDDLDKLSMFGSQSTFNVKTGKPVSKYKMNLGSKKLYFMEDKDMRFKYAWVQKNAAEGRAAVVCCPDTLYKIKWLQKSFKVHTNCPEDHYGNPDVLRDTKKMLRNPKGSSIFLMSDIKKSGLTFNRALGDIIFEELYKATGDRRYLHFVGWGNGKILYPGDGWHKINNGFGLGMADCVISFAQAVIYNIMIDKDPGIVKSYDLKAAFWSDDSLVKVTPKESVYFDQEFRQEFLNTWNTWLARIGIAVHDQKPFFSKMGVFLEEYTWSPWLWDSNKIGQYTCNILSAILCTDIFSAKSLVAAISLSADVETMHYTEYAVSRVVDYWGYEFSPEESELPYEIGGWTFFMQDGVNTLLKFLDEWEDIPKHLKFVRLLNFREKTRHSLKLHRDNKEYIDDITNMGLVESNSDMAWSKLSRSALLMDYNYEKDYVSTRGKNLRVRKMLYNQKPDDQQNEWLSIMRDFSDIVVHGRLYAPLFISVKSDIVFNRQFTPVANAAKRMTYLRQYLSACKDLGSSVDVWMPKKMEQAINVEAWALRRFLSNFCTHIPMSYDQALYVLTKGYMEETDLQLLAKRTGFSVIAKEPVEIDPVAYKLLDLLPEIDKNGSFISVPGMGAICTSLPAWSDMYNVYGSDLSWAVGLFYSAWAEHPLDQKLTRSTIDDIVEAVNYCINSSEKEHKALDEQKSTPLEDSEEDELRNMYFKDMVEGFARALVEGYRENRDAPVIQEDLLATGPGLDDLDGIFDLFGD
jgi:hypothetical protein